jgi:hypothetical protein
MAKSRADRLAEVRKRMQERSGRKARDPNRFSPSKVDQGEELSIKLVVLPPLDVGEACADGENTTEMGGMYSYQSGTHWVNKKTYECPRLHDNDDCPMCQMGFDLLSETEDKEERKKIVKTFLASETHNVNVYFPPFKSTPAELRGKVMWWPIWQRGIFQKFNECLNTNEDEAQGDTPDEQKPWGFFYEVDEAYVFLLKIVEKGGWNNYDQSKFLPTTRGKLADLLPKGTTVDDILAQRHDLGSKYEARDPAKLENIVKMLTEPEADSDDGFDEDELIDDTITETSSTSTDDDELIDDTATSTDDGLVDEPEEPKAEEPKAEEPKAEEKAESKKKEKVEESTGDDEEEVDALLAELQGD